MSDCQHQVITTISEITAIFIRCVCGEQVVLRRRSLDESLVSGVFCRRCDEQYWIRWSEGVLKRGYATREEIEASEEANAAIHRLLAQAGITPPEQPGQPASGGQK